MSISDESNGGGSSTCWLVKRQDGYHLIGNEIGQIAGPCSSALEALMGSGFQFGMDRVEITSRLPRDDLRTFLLSAAVILDNISSLQINGEDVDPGDVERALEGYRPIHR